MFKSDVAGELRQTLATLAVCLTAAQVASVWSYTATALPSLRESNDIPNLTTVAEDWIGGSQFLGALFASLVGGFVSQRKGHIYTILVFTPVVLLSWLLVIFAQNLPMLIIGRILSGFAAAAAAVPPPTFIAEIGDNKIRGKLGFYYDLFFCVGVLYINIFGAFLSWRFQAACCALIPLLTFGTVYFLKESPRKLLEISEENKGKAKESLMYYSKTSNYEDIRPEFEAIIEEVKEVRERSTASNETFRTRYLNASTIRPVLLCVILQFYLQMCGEIPIVGYTVDIFSATGTWFVNEYYATIIVGLTNLIMTIVASNFVDKYGRRHLMMLSQFFCGISLGMLALYMFLKASFEVGTSGYNVLTNSLSWVPLASLIFFMTAFSFGVGPMPWVILGEVVPVNARGYATGVSNMANRLVGFFPMFFFKDVSRYIGQHGAFLVFALINFSGIFYVYFCMPETNGVDLTEISSTFDNSRGCFIQQSSRTIRMRNSSSSNGRKRSSNNNEEEGSPMQVFN